MIYGNLMELIGFGLVEIILEIKQEFMEIKELEVQ